MFSPMSNFHGKQAWFSALKWLSELGYSYLINVNKIENSVSEKVFSDVIISKGPGCFVIHW